MITPENFCYWLRGYLDSFANDSDAHLTLDRVNEINRMLRPALKYVELTGGRPVYYVKETEDPKSKDHVPV